MGNLINSYRFAAAPPAVNYPLDNTGGAKMAYGFQRLATSDPPGGNVIRIRRLSDSAETDIGMSGDNLDTAAIDAFRAGADVRVISLYDWTGNGHTLTETSANSGALIVSGNVLQTLNGLPAIIPNGSQTYDTAVSFVSANGVGYYLGQISGNSMFSSEGGSGEFDALAQSASGSNASNPSGNSYRINNVFFPSFTRDSIFTELGTISPFILGIVGYPYSLYASYRLFGRFAPFNGFFQAAIIWDSDVSADVATIESDLNGIYGYY